MKNQKAAQKSQMIYEFGILVQPLEELTKASSPPSLGDYRIAIAKVQAGDPAWRQQVKAYTTFASDICFHQEYQDISHVPERCWQRLKRVISDDGLRRDLRALQQRFTEQVLAARAEFFELIDHIPVQWEPVVFQANTPFTSYLRIKEAIDSVKKRLDYFDRYLKADFFPLFLASIDRTVSVRLVTTGGNVHYGIAAVAAVARLARQEFSHFELIEVSPSELHDRNFRVDAYTFTLGPGVDRAGMALTNFGPSESSDDAHREFDRIIAGGRVVL